MACRRFGAAVSSAPLARALLAAVQATVERLASPITCSGPLRFLHWSDVVLIALLTNGAFFALKHFLS